MLPDLKREETAEAAAMHPCVSTEGTPTTLVLDDSPTAGKLVCKILAKADIPARSFDNPLLFLAETKSSQPALIVLDVKLERFDAIDLIRQLEVLEFKGKVLLMSGCEESVLLEIAQIGRSHGLIMLPPLRKPFGPEQVKASVLDAPSARHDHALMRAAHGRPQTEKLTLKEAIRRNWLEVWYQPKLDLKSLTISGAEALIRARHPEHGIIPPAKFLPSAGDYLYQTLSELVLQRVVADWAAFAQQNKKLRLAANVPASVINAPGFVDFIRHVLPKNSDFPGLIIELTEDEIIRDPEWFSEVSTQLALYNVFISIDDFGAGFASFSRLTDLRFAEIKLDAHFVANCGSDRFKRALCETVVDLARRFGASLCAEGVETVDDLRCLARLGFDTAQGFLIGKPMSTSQFATSIPQLETCCSALLNADEPSEAVVRSGS